MSDIRNNHRKENYLDKILEETLKSIGIKFKELRFIGIIAGHVYFEFGVDEISVFIHNKTEVIQYYNWI